MQLNIFKDKNYYSDEKKTLKYMPIYFWITEDSWVVVVKKKRKKRSCTIDWIGKWAFNTITITYLKLLKTSEAADAD